MTATELRKLLAPVVEGLPPAKAAEVSKLAFGLHLEAITARANAGVVEAEARAAVAQAEDDMRKLKAAVDKVEQARSRFEQAGQAALLERDRFVKEYRKVTWADLGPLRWDILETLRAPSRVLLDGCLHSLKYDVIGPVVDSVEDDRLDRWLKSLDRDGLVMCLNAGFSEVGFLRSITGDTTKLNFGVTLNGKVLRPPAGRAAEPAVTPAE